MDFIVLIPGDELREDDLQSGVRVHIVWDPYDSKPEAFGRIVEVRKWRREFGTHGDREFDTIIRMLDEESNQHREATYGEQWIEVID